MEKKEMKKSKWLEPDPPELEKTKKHLKYLYESEYKNDEKKIKKPLLILGDRGTGKTYLTEYFIELCKKESSKKLEIKEPINCAAFTETLIDSELFGHKKGAFTGAITKREGILGDFKNDGVLTLEEIGTMDKAIQAKFLTFIESGKYRPVGANESTEINFDLQILATANVDRKDFRKDFLDRFIEFRLPALYERREDILYYLRPKLGDDAFMELSQYDLLALLCYHWPGNVRGIEKYARGFKIFLKSKGNYIPPYIDVTHLDRGLSLTSAKSKELESELKKVGLSLFDRKTKPFEKEIPDNFKEQFKGLKIFCKYTGQETKAPYNLFNLSPENLKPENRTMTYKYYLAMMVKNHKNIKQAALASGIPENTFRDHLKKYGIR